jgi:D-glycero-D-manno-heptose 1,7-bisphosphate phosphatase
MCRSTDGRQGFVKRAAFLDRDGVINRKAPEGQYVTTWNAIQFLPGTVEAISLLNRAGFLVVVVTNQRCIARDLVTEEAVESLHDRMRRAFKSAGAIIDDFCYCPHDSDPACDCRKPKPGLLLTAARNHELSLARCWMIGDSSSDILAGRNAGCKTVLVSREFGDDSMADFVEASLLHAAHRILRSEASDDAEVLTRRRQGPIKGS